MGATRARPLILSFAEPGSSLTDACDALALLSPAAFVLCVPTPATSEQGRAALTELKRRYPEHLASGSVIVVARGAATESAVDLALGEPGFFARLVLIGGRIARFDTGSATRFAHEGGDRVLVVCGGPECKDAAIDVEARARGAGVLVRNETVDAKGATSGGAIDRVLTNAWPWLTADDPRWSPAP